MKRAILVKPSRRATKLFGGSQTKKRSQLIESRSSDQMDLFQAWLLYIGASPKAGLPASQIGIYTDFQ